MAKKEDKDEKQKKQHPILDTLESDIAHAYAILDNLKLCISANQGCRTSDCVRCRLEIQRTYWQVEQLQAENEWLRKKNHELKLLNEELLRYRTPDAYMDAVATALAMFPISGPTGFCGVKGLKNKTIKKAADILGLVATEEARDEARQRMQDMGMGDIENRGGHNSKAVEMLVNGKVTITFDSLRAAGRAMGCKNIYGRIQSGKTINGVLFRFKETNK